MPKSLRKDKTRADYLRRLSIVFALDLRIRIVTELYQREMSPKQFHEEFGGGTLSRVDKNFKKLVEHGWLRYIRSETGGGRRGARENFYRATALAFIDSETWALVPYSMRVAMSWRTFRVFGERVRDALEAGMLDVRAESRLGWMAVGLDQVGWDRVMTALDTLFAALFEEQEDSRLRIAHSGEAPIVGTVGLCGFESPLRLSGRAAGQSAPGLVHMKVDSPDPFMARVSKVFADEMCLRILGEANRREISAPLFHAKFDRDSIERVRRGFKKVESGGWLKQVSQKTGGRRRSAVELFYKATGPVILDDEPWAEAPDSIRSNCKWTTFYALAERVKEAILAGTFEARLDNHLTWSVLRLDQMGWERVAEAVDAALRLIFRECEAVENRLAVSAEEPIATTIGLVAFESPRSAIKEP